MKKKVTLNDLSAKLGLSTAAVSKALRGHEGVSENTRKLIFETARKMQYKGVPDEKNETKPVTGKVFVLTDIRGMTDSHTTSSYVFLDSALRAQGLEVALHPIPVLDNDTSIFDVIRKENPIALLLFGRFSIKFAEEFKKLIPCSIAIDHVYPTLSIDSVLPDNYHGAFLAVQHLVQMGHTRIGYIGDNSLSYSFRERCTGFNYALQYWGFDMDPKDMYNLSFSDAFGFISYGPVASEVRYDDLPTAFFCANDPIASVLNNSLNSRGIRTPEEVSIVGFDNLDSAQWQVPKLTTINFPREEIAVASVNMLLWRLANPAAACQKTLVRPDIVVRDSAVPPQK